MKNTFKKAGAVSVLSLLAFGAVSASAMGFGGMMSSNASPDEIASRHTTMFTQQASLLGMTVDEVKNAWAQGKTLEQLATEKGLTKAELQAKLVTQRTEQMKSHLSTLVSKGVLTQAQADKRLSFMQSQSSSKKGIGMHERGGKGMMGGFGF